MFETFENLYCNNSVRLFHRSRILSRLSLCYAIFGDIQNKNQNTSGWTNKSHFVVMIVELVFFHKKVGFNGGDGVNSFSSGNDVITLDDNTNVNTPGRWAFRVDEAGLGGEPKFGKCTSYIPAEWASASLASKSQFLVAPFWSILHLPFLLSNSGLVHQLNFAWFY